MDQVPDDDNAPLTSKEAPASENECNESAGSKRQREDDSESKTETPSSTRPAKALQSEHERAKSTDESVLESPLHGATPVPSDGESESKSEDLPIKNDSFPALSAGSCPLPSERVTAGSASYEARTTRSEGAPGKEEDRAKDKNKDRDEIVFDFSSSSSSSSSEEQSCNSDIEKAKEMPVFAASKEGRDKGKEDKERTVKRHTQKNHKSKAKSGKKSKQASSEQHRKQTETQNAMSKAVKSLSTAVVRGVRRQEKLCQQVEAAKATVANQKATLTEIREQLTKKQEKLDTATKDNKELKENLQNEEKSLEDAKSKITVLTRKIEESECDKKALSEKIKEAQASYEKQGKELREAQTQLAENEVKLKEVASNVERLETKMQDNEAQLKKATTELGSLTEKNVRLERDMQRLQQCNTALTQENEERKAQNQEMKNQLLIVRQEIQEKDKQLIKADADNRSLQQRIQQAEKTTNDSLREREDIINQQRGGITALQEQLTGARTNQEIIVSQQRTLRTTFRKVFSIIRTKVETTEQTTVEESSMEMEQENDTVTAQEMAQCIERITELINKYKQTEEEKGALTETMRKTVEKEGALTRIVKRQNQSLRENLLQNTNTLQYITALGDALNEIKGQMEQELNWILHAQPNGRQDDLLDELHNFTHTITNIVTKIGQAIQDKIGQDERQISELQRKHEQEMQRKEEETNDRLNEKEKDKEQLKAQLQEKEKIIKSIETRKRKDEETQRELEAIKEQLKDLSEENNNLREKLMDSESQLSQLESQSQQQQKARTFTRPIARPIKKAIKIVRKSKKKSKGEQPWKATVPKEYTDKVRRHDLPPEELQQIQQSGMENVLKCMDKAKSIIKTIEDRIWAATWNIESTQPKNRTDIDPTKCSDELKEQGVHVAIYEASQSLIQAMEWLKPLIEEYVENPEWKNYNVMKSRLALHCQIMCAAGYRTKNEKEKNDKNPNTETNEKPTVRNITIKQVWSITKHIRAVINTLRGYNLVVNENVTFGDSRKPVKTSSQHGKKNSNRGNSSSTNAQQEDKGKITHWLQKLPKETNAPDTRDKELSAWAFEDRIPDKELKTKIKADSENQKSKTLVIIKNGLVNVDEAKKEIRKIEQAKGQEKSTITVIDYPSKETKIVVEPSLEKVEKKPERSIQEKEERAFRYLNLMVGEGKRRNGLHESTNLTQPKAPKVIQDVTKDTNKSQKKEKETTTIIEKPKDKQQGKGMEKEKEKEKEKEVVEEQTKNKRPRTETEMNMEIEKEKPKDKQPEKEKEVSMEVEKEVEEQKNEKEKEKNKRKEKKQAVPKAKQNEKEKEKTSKPVIERPKKKQIVTTKTNKLVQLDKVIDKATQKCIYQCNSETIRAVLPQKLLDPLKSLVAYICKGIKEQRSPTAKQYYTTLLLQLPAIFLTPPHFENDKDKRSANEAIKQQIETFIKVGQLPSTRGRWVDQPLQKQEAKAKSKAYGDGNAMLEWWNVIFIQRAVQDGNIGRAANGFSLKEKADVNDKKVIEQLHQLHPKAYDKDPFAEEGELEIEEAPIRGLDVLDTVSRLKRGKAAGTSEWVYEEVKYFVKQPSTSSSFVETLVSLAKDLSVGKFPCTEMLKEARLIAIKKSESSVRPIAMGNAIPKLLATVVLDVRNREFRNQNGVTEDRLVVRKTSTMESQKKADEQMEKYALEKESVKTTYLGLEKEQLGVNSPCGVEVPGFIMMELFKQKKLKKFFTIDISNAFNTVSRKELARVVREVRPDLYPMVKQLYSTPTALRLANGTTISSEEGVRQGDPLSSYLYALVTNCVLQEEKKIAAEHGCQVFAYLDDHSFVFDDQSDTKLTVQQVLNKIQPILDKLHLKVNRTKCYTFIPSYVPNAEITKEELEDKEVPLKRDGCNCLGTPIGDERYVEEHVRMKLDKANSVFKHLHEVEVQAAYQVIRLSTAAEAMHLYRAVGDHPHYFKEWDERLYAATLQMCNRLPEYMYMQEKASEADTNQTQIEKLRGQIQEEEKMAKRSRDKNKQRKHEEMIRNLEKKIQEERQKAQGNTQSWTDKAFTEHGLLAAELIRTDKDFRRARLIMALKQSEGGLGIATAQMSVTPAHLGYILDCLKLAREREFRISLSQETIEYVKKHQDLIDAAQLRIPEGWENEGTKFYISGGSVQHLLTTALQQQVSAAIEHRTSRRMLKEMAEEEEGYTETTKNLIKQIPVVPMEGEEQFERAYGLVQDMKGKRAALSFSLGAYRRYYFIPNIYMSEMLATKLLIPNRYGITQCRGGSSDYEHPAIELNHAYSCSNNGARTTTHTQVAVWLMTLLKTAGLAATREPQITSASDPRYADIFVGSPQTIIDLSGVTTTRTDKSLTDAMEKRYNEKVKLYDDILRSDVVKPEYKQATVIPFIYGPWGQIHPASEHALLTLLGVDNRKLPQHKISTSARGQFQVCHPNSRVPEKTINAIKHLWKLMQLYIARYTAENAIAWGEQQAKRHRIDRQKYNRPTRAIPLDLRYDLNQSVQQQDRLLSPEDLLSKEVFDELRFEQDEGLPEGLTAVDLNEQGILDIDIEEKENVTTHKITKNKNKEKDDVSFPKDVVGQKKEKEDFSKLLDTLWQEIEEKWKENPMPEIIHEEKEKEDVPMPKRARQQEKEKEDVSMLEETTHQEKEREDFLTPKGDIHEEREKEDVPILEVVTHQEKEKENTSMLKGAAHQEKERKERATDEEKEKRRSLRTPWVEVKTETFQFGRKVENITLKVDEKRREELIKKFRQEDSSEPKNKTSNKTTGSTDSNETKITFNKNAPAFQYKIGRKELKGLRDDSDKQFSEISSFSSISNVSNVSGNSKDNTKKTAEKKSEYQQTRNGKY